MIALRVVYVLDTNDLLTNHLINRLNFHYCIEEEIVSYLSSRLNCHYGNGGAVTIFVFFFQRYCFFCNNPKRVYSFRFLYA